MLLIRNPLYKTDRLPAALMRLLFKALTHFKATNRLKEKYEKIE